MPITKTYLGWSYPVSLSAALALVSRFSTNSVLNALDLSALTIVVPTRQSGRLLLNELLRISDESNRILFPPQIITPLDLIEIKSATAEKSQELAAMIEALSACEELPFLYPSGIPAVGAGRFEAAEMLCSLRNSISENGLTFNQVLKSPVIENYEPGRWADLATIENEYLRILNQKGFCDRTEELVKGCTQVDSERFKKIIVISVPDPTPLAAKAMEALGEQTDLEIWINAPDSAAHNFDHLGRPLEGSFQCLPDIPLKNISIVRSPSDAAEKALQIISLKGSISADKAGIALFTDELVKPFENSFSKHDCKVYDPSGKSVYASTTGDMIANLLEMITKRDYESLSRLIRNPHLLYYLAKDYNKGKLFLAELDEFHDEYLPFTADALYSRLEIHEGRYLKGILSDFRKLLSDSGCDTIHSGSDLPSAIRSFLKIVYSNHLPNPANLDVKTIELQIKSVASELSNLQLQLSSFTIGLEEASKIITKSLKEARVYKSHEPDAVALQGWLEMNWSTASIVILSGFNEGFIPESVVSDPFLPERVREKLGLKCNSKRLTRDRFLLHTLIESKKEALYITVLKNGSDNQPYKPSRLLFACDQPTIVKRANYLFDEHSPESISPRGAVERIENPLVKPPAPIDIPDKLSVTAFKSYLACPFRFYLTRILNMKAASGDAQEMNPAVFGTICHFAMESYGKAYREIGTNENDISEFLINEARSLITRKYGTNHSLALSFQADNICNRLKKAAAIETRNRLDGWEIVACETSFSLPVNGMEVIGKIDRIEYNPLMNMWRVLDFKTSADAKNPLDTHLECASPEDAAAIQIIVNGKMESRKWVDLQIPLYLKLLEANRERIINSKEEHFNSKNVSAGYFNLPDELTKTCITLWEDLDNITVENAFQCSMNVIQSIKKGIFWPPAEQMKYDEMELLFVDTMSNNIDCSNLTVASELRGDA